MDKVKEEEAYKAVEKNLSGSRPRELFDDVIEDAEKDFEKDRTVLKVRLRWMLVRLWAGQPRGPPWTCHSSMICLVRAHALVDGADVHGMCCIAAYSQPHLQR